LSQNAHRTGMDLSNSSLNFLNALIDLFTNGSCRTEVSRAPHVNSLSRRPFSVAKKPSLNQVAAFRLFASFAPL
jgi:hypothetical protein